MADRPKFIRRKVAEEVVEPDEDVEEISDDGQEEEEVVAPVSKKVVVPAIVKKTVIAIPVAKKVVKKAPEPEPEDEDTEPVEYNEEVEVVAKPAKKVVVPAKPAAKAIIKAPTPKAIVKKVAAPEPEEEVETDAPAPKVRKVAQEIVEDIVLELMGALENGQAFAITKVDDSHWTIGPGGAKLNAAAAAAASGKLRGAEFMAEVCTPEYLAFDEEWGNLTTAEKMARAKKAGVKWERSEAKQVDLIRLTLAMREKLGIKKYKPQYESRKTRDALRA